MHSLDEATNSTRGQNFSAYEDLMVMRAWVCVSADSQNGTGQKLETITEKLQAAFTELAEEFDETCD